MITFIARYNDKTGELLEIGGVMTSALDSITDSFLILEDATAQSFMSGVLSPSDHKIINHPVTGELILLGDLSSIQTADKGTDLVLVNDKTITDIPSWYKDFAVQISLWDNNLIVFSIPLRAKGSPTYQSIRDKSLQFTINGTEFQIAVNDLLNGETVIHTCDYQLADVQLSTKKLLPYYQVSINRKPYRKPKNTTMGKRINIIPWCCMAEAPFDDQWEVTARVDIQKKTLVVRTNKDLVEEWKSGGNQIPKSKNILFFHVPHDPTIIIHSLGFSMADFMTGYMEISLTDDVMNEISGCHLGSWMFADEMYYQIFK